MIIKNGVSAYKKTQLNHQTSYYFANDELSWRKFVSSRIIFSYDMTPMTLKLIVVNTKNLFLNTVQAGIH